MRKTSRSWILCSAVCAALVPSRAGAAEPIRIALIEMMSGPFAAVGKSFSNHLDMAIEEINARGGLPNGAKIEVVRFDSKNSPQEAVLALRQATDMGIRHVFHGLGSHIAHALVEAVNKHNAREPGRSVLYNNFSSLDPALTNEKCSFYHFRFAANADMQIQALVRMFATRKEVRKVYLINQDYAYGQGVRRVVRELMTQRRRDVQFVGDDLHPLGKVKDFAPYIAKIKASGADAVLTSNWGNDLSLLVRAAQDAGLPALLFALNAAAIGTPTAIGPAGANRLWTVTTWHANAGEVWMRPDDHQLMQPQFVAVWTRAGEAPVKQDAEGTGYGFKTELRLDAKETTLPTTCKMDRPN